MSREALITEINDLSKRIRRTRGLRDAAQERLDELSAERWKLIKKLEDEE